jgi:hypothetical protein
MNEWQECTFLVRNLVVAEADNNGEQVITGEFSLTELKLIVSHFQPKPSRP